MKRKFIIRLNLFASIFFMACSSPEDKRLEQALAFAGDNRGELEKVLDHYKENTEKQEAARFLIRNMPRWYGYEGGQLDSIKPVLIQKEKKEIVPKEVIEKWRRVSFYSLPKVYDAKVITADYLIENIDLAFDVWKRYPWNRNLGFDDFCELILPYRIGDEPLSSWRKLYHDYYTAILDSSYQGDDVIEACKAVDKDISTPISGLPYAIRPESLYSSVSMSSKLPERIRGQTAEKKEKSIVTVSVCRKNLSPESQEMKKSLLCSETAISRM